MSTDPMTLYQSDDTEDKTIVFKGIAALFRAFDEMRGIDFVIVNNVSQAAFERIDRQREIRGRRFRFFFQAEKQQLLVTLPSPAHELMHSLLFERIYDDIVRSPSLPEFLPCAAITYSSNHLYGFSSNEADSGGYPHRDDDTIDDVDWPALVIECGQSQSLASLHAAMQWWFAASEHRVKVVLVIKLHRPTHTAIIEKFTEEEEAADIQHRPGATTTRSVGALTRLQPVLRQTITIVPVPDSSPARFHVTTGALVLEFALLYRRAPGPNERDVVVSEAQLETVAARTWRR